MNKLDLITYTAVHKLLGTGKTFDKPTFIIPNWTKKNEIINQIDRPDRFTVIYVGKRSIAKGYDDFIKISNFLSDLDISFIATVENKPSLYTLESNIKHVGYIQHEYILETLGKSHLLLHPTKHESFGIVILESLSVGTPVLTTPIEEHKEMGLPLFFSSNVNDFCKVIRSMYLTWNTQRQIYNRYIKANTASISKFYENNVLPKYEKMFLEVSNIDSRSKN